MSKLNSDNEVVFIGLVLEGLLYGLYSGLFVIFLHHPSPKKDGEKKRYNIVFYSICTLYALSVGLFAIDLMWPIYEIISKPIDSVIPLTYPQMTLFGLCDFIAQFILIYRCWIVWGRNVRVVIIPSILAFAFLVFWIGGGGVYHVSSGHFATPAWGCSMIVSGLAMSLAVNALVTGLIVFMILKVFRQVKDTSDSQILGATGGSWLRHTILVLIESGMALFSIQLVRLAVFIARTDTAFKVFAIVTSIHDMLTGITPTVILVRLSMGLSFHDEKSMEEVAISFLHTGTISIIDEDNIEGDDIDIQKSKNMEI